MFITYQRPIPSTQLSLSSSHIFFIMQRVGPSCKIFSGTSSEYLAEKIATAYGGSLGKISIQKFSDGEIQPIFLESIRGDYVFLVQSTFSPGDNLMELLLMIDAAKRALPIRLLR